MSKVVWVTVSEEDEELFEGFLKSKGIYVRKGSLLELREGFNTLLQAGAKNLALKYYNHEFDEPNEAFEGYVHYALFVKE